MMSATCFTLPPRPVAQRSSPAAGRLEATDQDTCVLHTGSNSLDELAPYAALKGFDFQVLHPPELIPAVRAWRTASAKLLTPRCPPLPAPRWPPCPPRRA
jgi:hypothetical protein